MNALSKGVFPGNIKEDKARKRKGSTEDNQPYVNIMGRRQVLNIQCSIEVPHE